MPAVPAPAAAPAAGGIPFEIGSNEYVEKFDTFTQQLLTTTVDRSVPVTPGGFLRGVVMQVTSTGGALGGGALTGDTPWVVLASVTLENVDGSPIMYPMTGYAHFIAQKYLRPYGGDPERDSLYSNSVNPGFTLTFFPEITGTMGALDNTDARATYRFRYTLNTLANVIAGGAPTAPTLTVVCYAAIWAQPDSHDLHGNAIAPLPDGRAVAHIYRHQIATLNPANSNNQVKFDNVGNELRGWALILRDSNNARQDYLSDPIRFRQDNRSLEVTAPAYVGSKMHRFYQGFGFEPQVTAIRPTGVYVFPRFRQPDARGEYWVPTNTGTLLQFESTTLGGAVNLPGTIEILTSEIIPLGPIPAHYEGL